MSDDTDTMMVVGISEALSHGKNVKGSGCIQKRGIDAQERSVVLWASFFHR